MKSKLFLFISLLLFPSIVLSVIPTNANLYDYTVEGDMTRFVTGETFPTAYNAKDDEVYVNVELEGGTQYVYNCALCK